MGSPQHEQCEKDIAELKASVIEIKKTIAELNASIDELLDMWHAGRGMLTIIKWMAGIASGFAAVWAVINNTPHQ